MHSRETPSSSFPTVSLCVCVSVAPPATNRPNPKMKQAKENERSNQELSVQGETELRTHLCRKGSRGPGLPTSTEEPGLLKGGRAKSWGAGSYVEGGVGRSLHPVGCVHGPTGSAASICAGQYARGECVTGKQKCRPRGRQPPRRAGKQHGRSGLYPESNGKLRKDFEHYFLIL